MIILWCQIREKIMVLGRVCCFWCVKNIVKHRVLNSFLKLTPKQNGFKGGSKMEGMKPVASLLENKTIPYIVYCSFAKNPKSMVLPVLCFLIVPENFVSLQILFCW